MVHQRNPPRTVWKGTEGTKGTSPPVPPGKGRKGPKRPKGPAPLSTTAFATHFPSLLPPTKRKGTPRELSRCVPFAGNGLAASYFPALLNAVSSPQRPFTTVFGMGTGVTSSPWPPVQKGGCTGSYSICVCSNGSTARAFALFRYRRQAMVSFWLSAERTCLVARDVPGKARSSLTAD